MGNFGRFGGGQPNMQALMRQAQKMQEDMMRAQEELAQATVEGTSGGGMVTITMTGKKEITSVKLKKEAVDPDDIEMLEDLIVAAIKDADNKVEELSSSKLGAFGNLGGFGGLM